MGSRSRSGESKVETKTAQDSSSLTETPKFTLQNFPQPLSTKLDDLNFLIWRLQVVTIINGYDLYNFLIRRKHIPSQFLSGEDELLNRQNPYYLNSKCQDQVLMSWMLMSKSDGMVSRMVRQRQLFTHLRSTKKGSLSMSDYLLKLKKVVDALASIYQPITDQDYIETILHGLPSEYEGFITSFSLKDKEHIVIQVEAHLLAHEARLEAHLNNKGGFANRGNNRGRGRSQGGHGGRRTLCQVCGRHGHIGVNCYHRSDQSYTATTLMQNQNLQVQNSRLTIPSAQNVPVEALLATPETLYDASWYPDSGASSHLTNDATNLQEQQTYIG
ncbi:Retrovirus-related Pol polyprotein from transposon TNT 1-94 [Senna tora]|uniref:Retrovirus-related Pol polyprotein from transposon TNT 1-94 n=1 Tax=Senna tora TaxID=362788 RepID=A0A835CHS2_9FABA|nr:Retrovirus-related Pol polyprotein from transposon TNT 1-94 [Senna tora]